jgi:hypothetical protein
MSSFFLATASPSRSAATTTASMTLKRTWRSVWRGPPLSNLIGAKTACLRRRTSTVSGPASRPYRVRISATSTQRSTITSAGSLSCR